MCCATSSTPARRDLENQPPAGATRSPGDQQLAALRRRRSAGNGPRWPWLALLLVLFGADHAPAAHAMQRLQTLAIHRHADRRRQPPRIERLGAGRVAQARVERRAGDRADLRHRPVQGASTTASATRPATRCWCAWRMPARTRCASSTCSAASAARNSWCCCRAPASSRRAEVAERLRGIVAALPTGRHRPPDLNVTISVGVAALGADRRRPQGRPCDARTRRCTGPRQNGRNRVEVEG